MILPSSSSQEENAIGATGSIPQVSNTALIAGSRFDMMRSLITCAHCGHHYRERWRLRYSVTHRCPRCRRPVFEASTPLAPSPSRNPSPSPAASE